MIISRKKFVMSFIFFAFIFLFVSTSLLGTTGVRGFPKYPDSLLRTGGDSLVVWKRVVSTIILPIKIVLIGPLALPQIHFLKEDPPPPFIGFYLIFYWTFLALLLYDLLKKGKNIFPKR